MKPPATSKFFVALSAVLFLGSAIAAFSPPPQTTLRPPRQRRGRAETLPRTSGRGVPPRALSFDVGGQRNEEVVDAASRQGMLENGRAGKSVEAEYGGWRVPRAAVEQLGRGLSAGGDDDYVEEDFLPFDFELSRTESAKKKRTFWGAFPFPPGFEADPSLAEERWGGGGRRRAQPPAAGSDVEPAGEYPAAER
uniref:Uncharacterized protein n=1 Tax=Odontella aurita TaxID=265563 RepID=A0A7S4K861_9STRA